MFFLSEPDDSIQPAKLNWDKGRSYHESAVGQNRPTDRQTTDTHTHAGKRTNKQRDRQLDGGLGDTQEDRQKGSSLQ